jgi:hypothetical protein
LPDFPSGCFPLAGEVGTDKTVFRHQRTNLCDRVGPSLLFGALDFALERLFLSNQSCNEAIDFSYAPEYLPGNMEDSKPASWLRDQLLGGT